MNILDPPRILATARSCWGEALRDRACNPEMHTTNSELTFWLIGLPDPRPSPFFIVEMTVAVAVPVCSKGASCFIFFGQSLKREMGYRSIA